MTPGAVLWDLDGTLVDSEEYHWRSWRDTMAKEGVDLSYEQFRASFGQRNDSILRRWLGPDLAAGRMENIADRKEEQYRLLVRTGGLAPLPGAAEWVRRLHSKHWAQAIASSAPRLNIEAVLEVIGLADQFEASVSAEDVQIGKPDPQVFLLAASRLALPPSRCIVVEDAAAGIEAARRAGMRSIAVAHDGPSMPADIVVRSLADLPPQVFSGLLSR